MNVPHLLATRAQWVLWRSENGTKVPYTTEPGRKASSTDPTTWTTVEAVLRCYEANRDRYNGPGYVLSGTDGMTGVDLDGCRDRDTGNISEAARAILDDLNSYSEVSPSGTGVKVWVQGTLPKAFKVANPAPGIVRIEVYPRDRYFAFTGQRLGEYPAEPQEAQAALDALAAAFDAPRDAPLPMTSRVVLPTSATHDERWARDVLARAVAMVTRAVDGEKHDVLFDAARLAGGVASYLSEREIEQALYGAIAHRAQDRRGALKTIRDGMRTGAAAPLQPPVPPTSEPLIIRGQRPWCPSCATQVRRSKHPYPGTDEPGWYCPECKHPMVWPLAAVPPTTPPVPDAPDDRAGAPATFHRTDLGNARRLVAHHGADLRFVPAWNSWLVWNGQYWQKDENGAVHRRARQTVARIYQEAAEEEDPNRRKALAAWATTSESRGRLESMVVLAQAEDGIPVDHEQLNANPYQLTVANGTLDLRTGKLLPFDRDHLMTKALPIAYSPAATCRRWEAFLRRVLGDDDALIAFVHRAVGYTLTADTREQCLFFLYGTGRNGKSTFIETLLDLLGPYGQKAPTEMLMARPMGGGIPNDVAQLPGLRGVVTAETEEGRRLNESLVKDLTGGDRLTARFMRAEFFTFRPTHKLWMYGNHKPVIRGTDNGIWRRIRAIPFTVTIPDDEVDPELLSKLRAELPGILAWAVRGCLAWQAEGLGAAEAVDAATAAYRAEMDILGAFLDARCVIAPHARVKASVLYQAYREWAEGAGEFVMSLRRFGGQLTERGFGQHKDRDGNIQRTGIGLLASQPPPPGPGMTEERTEERTMTEEHVSIHNMGVPPYRGDIHEPPSSSVPPSNIRHPQNADDDQSQPTDDLSPAQALAERLRRRAGGGNA